MSPQKAAEPGTKCHNSTTTLVRETSSNTPIVQPHSQLVETTSTGMSNQAIDTTIQPGVVSARCVRKLMTPSGMKDVIIISDGDINLNEEYDYVPGLSLPEPGHVWSGRYTSTPTANGPFISDYPRFNLRTLHYLAPYKYFHSHLLVRLVCKPSLMQAQNFWVSRSFEPGTDNPTENSKMFNSIGFNWNPSKCNEVFVLMPWSHVSYMAKVRTPLSILFGYLRLTPLSQLVYTEGNDIPLDVSYYFAPYNLKQYVPESVKLSSGIVNERKQFLLKPRGSAIARFADPIEERNVGILTSNKAFIPIVKNIKLASNLWAINKDFTIDVVLVEALNPNTSYRITRLLSDANNALGERWIPGCQNDLYPLPAGNYIVRLYNASQAAPTAKFTLLDRSDGDLMLEVIVESGSSINFVPAFSAEEQSDTVIRTEEINNNCVIPKVEYPSGVFNIHNIPHNFVIVDSGLNPETTVANSFTRIQMFLKYSVKVISQSPSIVEVLGEIGRGNVVDKILFANYGQNQSIVKRQLCEMLINYMKCIGTPTAQEEIFEYSYNPISSTADNTYGATNDTSPREDQQDVFFKEYQLTSSNKFDIQTIEIDLDLEAEGFYPPVNLREYRRHYLKSHYPIIKIRSNKNPLSNVLLTVRQGEFSTIDEMMQFPGKEWDPTLTDLVIQPYWDQVDPAVKNMKVILSFTCLSGQIDNSGMSLLAYINTSPIKYHHKIDYSFQPEPPTAQVKELTDICNLLNYCKKCLASKCLCKNLPSTSKFAEEQIGGDGVSVLEREEIEEAPMEVESSNIIDGTTMQTLPTPAPREAGKVEREKDYHPVGFATIPIENASDKKLKFVVIPISHHAFGKEEVTSARKYHLYKGTPRFKITISTSSTTGGFVYACNLPPDAPIETMKSFDPILMYNTAQQVFWNTAQELTGTWMTTEPYQIVRYTPVADPPAQLGYLVLAIPAITSGNNANLTVALHCNTSDITYLRPSYSDINWEYDGLKLATIYN